MPKFIDKLSMGSVPNQIIHAKNSKISSKALKVFTISFLFVTIPGAFGSILDPNAYENPIYQDVIFNIFPWWGWALSWFLATLLILIYAIKSNYLAFITANLIIIFLSINYALMFLYGKLHDNLPLSYLSVGIWLSIAFSAIAAILADVPILWQPGKRSK